MLGTVELLKLVKEVKLVENLCDRELNNPEGTGFDLQLGGVYKFKDGMNSAFLGVEERFTPETELVAKYGVDKDIFVKPGDYYIIETIEKVNMPKDMVGFFRPRTTLQRSGLGLISGTCNPGYSGKLSFGLYNVGPNTVKIELGARLVHMLFDRTGENVSSYRGQWQGGRVSTEGKKEVQV